MTDPIKLDNVRRHRDRLAHFYRFDPILNALECAPENEKKERLFWAACRFREMIEEGIYSPKIVWSLLRFSAVWGVGIQEKSLPDDEIDRTISAGLFKGRR